MPDPCDRRRVRLELTDRGAAVRASALKTSEKLEAELASARTRIVGSSPA